MPKVKDVWMTVDLDQEGFAWYLDYRLQRMDPRIKGQFLKVVRGMLDLAEMCSGIAESGDSDNA